MTAYATPEAAEQQQRADHAGVLRRRAQERSIRLWLGDDLAELAGPLYRGGYTLPQIARHLRVSQPMATLAVQVAQRGWAWSQTDVARKDRMRCLGL